MFHNGITSGYELEMEVTSPLAQYNYFSQLLYAGCASGISEVVFPATKNGLGSFLLYGLTYNFAEYIAPTC